MTLSRELLKTKGFWWVMIIDSIPIIICTFLAIKVSTNIQTTIIATGYFSLGMFMLIVGIKELALLNRYRIELNPKNDIQWSSIIKSRNGNKCIYCDETDHLDAHHLAPKAIYPSLRFNINNGITVCKGHHGVAADIFKRLLQICRIEAK